MAVQVFTRTEFGGAQWRFRWAALANGDSGAPIACPGWGDNTVAFQGTFGAGGTAILEGTLDDEALVANTPGSVIWFPLTDPQGNAISKTTAGIETIMENCTFIRPRVTAGDGTTAIIATVFSRRNNG